MKLVVIGLVFLSAVGALVWVGIVEGSIPVLQVHQLKAQPPSGRCRVDEAVIESIESARMPVRFTMRADGQGGQVLPVELNSPAPDNFKVGIPVSVLGTYDAKMGIFRAEKATTKCPSIYKAAGEATGEAKAYKPSPVSPEKGP